MLISGSNGKESACNTGYLGSVSGSERSPGEGNGYPLHYFCLENSMDRGAWQGYSPRCHRVGHYGSKLACAYACLLPIPQ